MDFKKEFRRLEKNIKEKWRYYGKKGADVVLPVWDRPKNPTKEDVEYLSYILENFRDEYVFYLQDEVALNPDEYNAYKRREKKYKEEKEDLFNKTTVSNFYTMIRRFPTKVEPLLSDWLTTSIQTNGLAQTARGIYLAFKDGHIVTPDIAYDDALLAEYMDKLFEYIGLAEHQIDELMEDFETPFDSYE